MRPSKEALLNFARVSIHASVKDATFNVTDSEGGTVVSIHASVKDATSLDIYPYPYVHGFNPRICKRCDYAPTCYVVYRTKFQSTHL